MRSYGEFSNVKPIIDGRADMYGGAFLASYTTALRPDRAVFERTVQQYGIRWALLGAHSPAVPMIDALPHWRRLYADKVAAVHVRE